MKRFSLLLFLIFAGLSPSAFSQALSAGIGADFLNYDRPYLDVRAQYIHHLNPDVEVFMGGSFAISTRKNNGETQADFLIPADLGVNFLFPLAKTFAWYFGIGGTAQFLIPQTDTKRFYAGPFANLGIRVGLHPYMEWYLEARQDLLFGKPDWINTSTRLSTGIVFPL